MTLSDNKNTAITFGMDITEFKSSDTVHIFSTVSIAAGMQAAAKIIL